MLVRRSLPLILVASSFASLALLHCSSTQAGTFVDEPDAASVSSSGGPVISGDRDATSTPQEAGAGVCGDGRLALEEECDDNNASGNDGCSPTCTLEPGWTCPTVGLACVAAACGDGIVAGLEECEPLAGDAGVGCSAACTIEPGYDCDPLTKLCNPVVCGDGVIQRGESCEEAQPSLPFDGCYQCKKETSCVGGVCQATCGDGQRFAGEACDDGNLRDGDGCSATCTVEPGFACADIVGDPPSSIPLPILVRDFVGHGNAKDGGPVHENFNDLTGPPKAGIVLAELGADKKPHLVCPGGGLCTTNPGYLSTGSVNPNGRPNITDEAHFDDWYNDRPSVNRTSVSTVSLDLQANGTYKWSSASAAQNGGKTWFDPVGSGGWVGEGKEDLQDCGGKPRNVSFTSETHFYFEYQGGERFDFAGDDDTWIFVNGKLAVDLGGLHGVLTGYFTLNGDDDGAGPHTADGQGVSNDDLRGEVVTDFGLSVGGIYEVVMFQAERNECGSNFTVTLKNFNQPKSVCQSTCGDGVVARDEVCDDGVNDGSYGGCAAGCKARGPSCGDGVLDPAHEQCDDGNDVNTDTCSNGCTLRTVN